MTDGQVLWPAAKKTRGSRKDWGPQHRRDRTSAKRPSWYEKIWVVQRKHPCTGGQLCNGAYTTRAQPSTQAPATPQAGSRGTLGPAAARGRARPELRWPGAREGQYLLRAGRAHKGHGAWRHGDGRQVGREGGPGQRDRQLLAPAQVPPALLRVGPCAQHRVQCPLRRPALGGHRAETG